uniref:Uncharacterized protein n=1 Tax=Arundo donax TaxID=35708 RepID=A0A0A9FD84_ARUDO
MLPHRAAAASVASLPPEQEEGERFV